MHLLHVCAGEVALSLVLEKATHMLVATYEQVGRMTAESEREKEVD